MECYVIKYADGKYMDCDHYYGKTNSWQEAYIYENIVDATNFVLSQQGNKQAFIKDSTGYINGLKPEDFDCEVVKWIIEEKNQGGIK